MFEYELMEFVQALLVHNLGGYNWLSTPIRGENCANWDDNEVVHGLIGIGLSLYPYIQPFEFAFRLATSHEAQEELRQELEERATDPRACPPKRSRYLPGQCLELLRRWATDDDYRFSSELVREQHNHSLTDFETRHIEFVHYVYPYFMKNIDPICEKFRDTVWLDLSLDGLDFCAYMERDERGGQTFERANYDCSSNTVTCNALFQHRDRRIIVKKRRLAARAGFLQGLLSQHGLPPLMPDVLRERMALPLQRILPEDLDISIVYHELGHRNAISFMERYGFTRFDLTGNPGTKPGAFSELVADLYALIRLREHAG